MSDESGRSDICGFPAARASLYGGAGDSSDLTLGWCDRSEVTEGCDLPVGWLRTEPAVDEWPPIKSSASKLNTRRCRAHLLPRGSPPVEAADLESSCLRLLRAKMMNAIMQPRQIRTTGTATAACLPAEHDIPLHCFCSERTAEDPAVEAAAGLVKDVLSVEGEDDVMITDEDASEEVDVISAAADVWEDGEDREDGEDGEDV